MKILFKTFPIGHLVSDKEFDKLQKGFKKEDMELVRDGDDYDIVMVKGFSHTWNDVKDLGKPIVYYSIGTEWKEGIDIEAANEPIKELYKNADAVVHISKYCQNITKKVFGNRKNQCVIIPANEVKPEMSWHELDGDVRCVSTAIWRPIKRCKDLRTIFHRLKEDGIEVSLDIYGSPEGPMLDDLSAYNNFDIYIQISRKEGMPNTVLEAMSYGLPVLTTNHGGAKEAVGDAGIVIDNDPDDNVMPDLSNIETVDYEKFKVGLKKIIINYDYYRNKVKERINNEMNDEICAKQFKKVFNKLI